MMARTTISISDELKERMDEVDGINWSRLASRAFELELDTRASGNGSLGSVVQRLRASKLQSELPGSPGVKERGRKWARDDAEFEALRRISAIDLNDIDDDDDTRPRLFNTIMEALGDHLSGEEGVTEVRDVIMGDLDRNPSLNQMKWWIAGVQDVWEQVKDEL